MYLASFARLSIAAACLLAPACSSSPADTGGDDSGVDSTASSADDAATTAGDDATSGPSGPSTSGTPGTSDDTGPADSSSSGGEPDPCETPLGSGADPIFERAPGRFSFRSFPGYTSLAGAVRDGPQLEFHEEAERSGMCRLLTYEGNGFCDPLCEPPEVCIGGECTLETPNLDAGDATLAGVGDDVIPLGQDPFHTYFWDSVAPLELSMLTLAATGAAIPAFELSACPVDAPEPVEDWNAQMSARPPGESVTLAWSNPVDTARIYMRMTTGIGTHGGISPVELECEGPDIGALELPGAYLDALYAQGWSCGECGGNDLFRYHADETMDADPVVQFRAEAVTSFYFIP